MIKVNSRCKETQGNLDKDLQQGPNLIISEKLKILPRRNQVIHRLAEPHDPAVRLQGEKGRSSGGEPGVGRGTHGAGWHLARSSRSSTW